MDIRNRNIDIFGFLARELWASDSPSTFHLTGELTDTRYYLTTVGQVKLGNILNFMWKEMNENGITKLPPPKGEYTLTNNSPG